MKIGSIELTLRCYTTTNLLVI